VKDGLSPPYIAICGFKCVQVSDSYVASGIYVVCVFIVCPRTRRVRSGYAVLTPGLGAPLGTALVCPGLL